MIFGTETGEERVRMNNAEIYKAAKDEADERNFMNDTNYWTIDKILNEWSVDIEEWESYWNHVLNF